MHYLIPFFLYFLFSVQALTAQEICIDKNTTIQYSSDELIEKSRTVGMFDGGSVTWGGDVNLRSMYTTITLLRLDKMGEILWSTKLQSDEYSFSDVKVVATESGRIWVAGVAIPSAAIENGEIFYGAIHSDGTLEFLKFFKASWNGKSGNAISVAKPAVDKSGNIYFGYNYENTVINRNPIAVVCKVNQQGLLEWNRSFEGTSALIFHTMFIKNDRLMLASNSGSSISYVNLQLGSEKGNVIDLRAYEPFGYIKFPGASELVQYGANKYVSVGYNSASSGERDAVEMSLVVMDSALNPIQCYQLQTFDVLHVNGWGAWGKNLIADGDNLLIGINRPTENSWYLAAIDSNFHWKYQKRIQFAGRSTADFSAFPLAYAFDNKFYFRSITDLQQTGKSILTIASMNQGIRGENDCFSTFDTSFIRLKTFGLKQVPFQLTSVQDDVVVPLSVAVNQTAILFNRSNVCTETISCEKPVISGPATICIGEEEVIFTTNKAPDCTNTITWNIQPSESLSIHVIDEKSIALRFKENWQGNLISRVEGRCALSDTLFVTAALPPTIDILSTDGTELSVCQRQNDTLYAAPGFKEYLWQDSSRKEFFSIQDTGLYWVRVTDAMSCQAYDSIRITAIHPAPASFLPADTSSCPGDPIEISSIASYDTYLWNTGSRFASIRTDHPGKYWLQVTDSNGCKGVDSILISTSDCSNTIYVPNAFSPDGNRINDHFKPIFKRPVRSYALNIYNRWGQLVFTSANPTIGWDGKVKGVVSRGVFYIWTCQYSFSDTDSKIAKGTVYVQ